MVALGLVALAGVPLPGGTLIHEHLPNVLQAARVGEWVTYRFADGASEGRVYFWRVAVVGEQLDARGRPAVWVELDVGTHHAMKAPLSSMKVLAARATGMTAEGITRLIVAYGVERPREVEPSDLATLLGRGDRPALEPASGRALPQIVVKRGEPSRLVTLGGTVTARALEVRLQQTVFKRYWLSEQIPILHLAKLELPAVQHSMEVRDWGLDATPQMPPPDPAAATIRMEGVR
jgi:hypothetical protein